MPFKRGNILGSAARQQKLDVLTVRWIKTILLRERLMRRDKPRQRAPRGMYERIAERTGVSANQIKKIALRQRWRRVRVDVHTQRLKGKL